MSLLHSKHPIVISVELAQHIGLNEAIVLQQVNYWLEGTGSGVEHDGRRWVYNTHEQWREQFPFWSTDTVKRALKSLQKQALLLVKQLAKAKHDRTNYYSVDHEALAVIEAATRVVTDQGKLPSSKSAKSTSRKRQTAPVEEGNLPSSSGADCPDLHTEITQRLQTETLPPTKVVSKPDAGGVVVTDGVQASFGSPDKGWVRPDGMSGPKDPECKTYWPWTGYAWAYHKRYGVYPAWNAQAGKQLSLLVDRVGAADAPYVAITFLRIKNDFYIKRHHPLDLLLRDYESIRTQWLTKTSMTSTKARQQDQSQTNFDAAGEAKELMRQRRAQREGQVDANT